MEDIEINNLANFGLYLPFVLSIFYLMPFFGKMLLRIIEKLVNTE